MWVAEPALESVLRPGNYPKPEPPDPLDEVMTLREASEVYPVKFRTLHSAREAGRLRARKSGSTWLVTRSDVIALCEG
jgi:hypothetical protein